MKRYLLFFVVVFLFGCQENGSVIIDKPEFVLDNIPNIENPYNIDSYLSNIENEDDRRIKSNLLKIAKEGRELFRDKSYSRQIIENAKLNTNHCQNLLKLSSNTNLKSGDIKFDEFITLVENVDLSFHSNSMEKSATINSYIPAIFVFNSEFADFDKTPLFCVGIEACNGSSYDEKYENYIVAWYYTDSEELKEILISEDAALKTTNPVFIFDNAEDVMTQLSGTINTSNIEKDEISLKSTSSIKEFSSYEFQINKKYDNSPHAELWITGVYVKDNGEADFLRGGKGGEIARVAKGDIGKLLYKWVQFKPANVDFEPFYGTHVYFNLFERDWYGSLKNFGIANVYGTNYYISGNSSSSSQWYLYDPSEPMPKVNLSRIYRNWAEWFTSDKCKFRVWYCE